MLSPERARADLRKAIQRSFAEIVRKRKGQLESAAAEIGCKRQSLEQYAAGTKPAIPSADVLLMAMACWNLKIVVEDREAREGERRRWECGLFPERTRKAEAKPPVQLELPLHLAIKDLEEEHLEVRILKRDPGRIELGVDIAFPRRLA